MTPYLPTYLAGSRGTPRMRWHVDASHQRPSVVGGRNEWSPSPLLPIRSLRPSAARRVGGAGRTAQRERRLAQRERERGLRRACAGCAVGLTELDRYMTVTDVTFVVWHLPTYAEPLIWMSKSTNLPIQGAPRGRTDPLFGRCAEPSSVVYIHQRYISRYSRPSTRQ